MVLSRQRPEGNEGEFLEPVFVNCPCIEKFGLAFLEVPVY